jgi:biopolymer transport protein ExbB/TolQ
MTAPISTAEETWSRAGKHLDKIFFAGAALAGAVSIVLVDLADGSKWVAVGICVAVMVVYLVAALALPGLKLRPDQAADNLYYLGLLFTLTSLGVALIRFASSEQATTAILRNFGIAIFTTIVGLAMRVFVGQFREDPEDFEHEARAALSESVHRMRAELDTSVVELRGFADGMRQVVGEFMDGANKTTAQALERSIVQFERSAVSVGERFDQSAQVFADRVQSFDASLEKVVTALEALMVRIGAVRADADLLERGMRPALDVLERSVGDFAKAIAREQQNFEAGAEAFDTFHRGMGHLVGSSVGLTTVSRQLSAATASLGGATDLISRLDAAATSAARSTATFAARLAEIATRIEERDARAIETVHRSAEAAAQRAATEAESRLKSLETAAGRVVQTLDRLDAEFADSGDTVRRVRRELTELAGWIIERLDRR